MQWERRALVVLQDSGRQLIPSPADMPPDIIHYQCFPGESSFHSTRKLHFCSNARLQGEYIPTGAPSLGILRWMVRTHVVPQYSITTLPMSWWTAKRSLLASGIPRVKKITTDSVHSHTPKLTCSSSVSLLSVPLVTRTSEPRYCVSFILHVLRLSKI